jgi:UDP-N-acetylglucosamine--N-acetylmuramyl-(pentapeptide) pyrophosphoryl-undecaprenol N-acetylglucosamine transferase
MIKDSEAQGVLVTEALKLLGDETKKGTYKDNIKKLAKPDAAKTIASEVLRIIKEFRGE